MKRRLPQQPHQEEIKAQNDDEQPPIASSDSSINRGSSVQINDSNTPSNSIQQVVEGQFDDASSPDTGQFDDTPDEEIVNRRRKLMLIQGAHKRDARMEGQDISDKTSMEKEAGASPGNEVKANLVSFEESSPPKEKDGSKVTNKTGANSTISTCTTSTPAGTGARSSDTSVSSLSKTGGHQNLKPTTSTSTRSTPTGTSTLYESTSSARASSTHNRAAYLSPPPYAPPRQPIHFRGTIDGGTSTSGTKRSSSTSTGRRHQRRSDSPHQYQHFELQHQQQQRHQQHTFYPYPYLPPNQPNWRHNQHQQHHYQYFHHPPSYSPFAAGISHPHSHVPPHLPVDNRRRGSASSSNSSSGPPPQAPPYWGPVASASLSSSSPSYINNPHQRQDSERQRREGEEWMAKRPRTSNTGTTSGTGTGAFHHQIRKDPNESSRSIEDDSNDDDNNDTVEENKMPPLSEARSIPMEFDIGMGMGMGPGYVGGGGGKMPPLDQPPPRMRLNMHVHEREEEQECLYDENQHQEEQVQSQSRSQNEHGHEHENVQGNPDEEQIPSSDITANDVLMGRGGGTNRHNTHFRELVSEAQPQYVQARKKDKTRIARSIVATIRSRNGRFLKLHPNGYYLDVGDKQATLKTSQALREGLSGRMREIVKVGGRAPKADDRASKKKGG